MLSVSDHRRDRVGLTYVYPVISRRSGGLSIGINLNPNNACNWRCIYCQVPGLRRGAAPAIDLGLLHSELKQMLGDALQGDFYDRFAVPEQQRVIRDIAISGNGEATTAREFPQVVEMVGKCCNTFGLAGRAKLVLISNGSRVRDRAIQEGLQAWGNLGGELWFKLDSATPDGLERINGVRLHPDTVLENLATAATRCPVWIQTCVFILDGKVPESSERSAYLAFLAKALERGIQPEGVLLYGLARPSQQPEARRLAALPPEWLEALADEIRRLGLVVRVNP
ncbi:MAG: radical SAM protein [Methylococcaceae bacterium]|nr:radical SAM protein [Methylococcaceae bacterium]